MKTLFGERKSVKTLAFILALALILPLLPVMSVVGETFSASSITFADATEGADDDPVYYYNKDGTAAINGQSAGATIQWESLGGLKNLKVESVNDGIKVKLDGKQLTTFKFTVEKNNLSGDFAIYVSTDKDFSTEKTIELKPDTSDVYLINSDVFTALKLESNTDIYVKSVPVKTVTLPDFESAKSDGYSLSKDGSPVYGAQNTTNEKYEFDIKYDDTTATPEVTAYTSNYNELTVNLTGATAGQRHVEITGVTASITVTITLRPAVSISYSPAPGTATESFTITGNGDLNSVPYNKNNFQFTVRAADGYTIKDVKLNGESIVDKGQESNTTSKTCTIAGPITKNLTVYVTTEAVKPKVTLKAPSDNEKGLYTVSGIVAGENGITVSYGGSFTFSVTPKAGYDSLKVSYKMGTSGSETVITPNGNTYTINGIMDDVTITINAGDITKFKADFISDGHVSKVTDDEGAYKWEDDKTIEYNSSQAFKVKPDNGYKVTAIKVYDGNNLLISNENSTSITVSNITSDLRIEVTTEPITITVNVSNGGNLNGTYVFKYGESKFDGNWINWETNQFESDNVTNLVNLIAESYKKEATRFGFTSPEWDVSGSIENPNADVSFALTATWTPDLSTLFVLKTSVEYSKTLNRLSFISRLEVNELADDEAKRQYSGSVEQGTVKVISYGVFYGQYSASLTDDPNLVSKVRSVINSNKATNINDNSKEVSNTLWGNDNNGKIYFYSTKASEPIDFQVSSAGVTGNTITEYFDEKSNSSFDRSGITWMEIEVDGETAVIVGPATTYSVT